MSLKKEIKNIIYKINPNKKSWEIEEDNNDRGWYSIIYKSTEYDKRHICWVSEPYDLLNLYEYLIWDLILWKNATITCQLKKK